MLKTTNVIGSLEAALSVASLDLYNALCTGDKKAVNKSNMLVSTITKQIGKVLDLMRQQEELRARGLIGESK